jgi:hypothetical protein
MPAHHATGNPAVARTRNISMPHGKDFKFAVM